MNTTSTDLLKSANVSAETFALLKAVYLVGYSHAQQRGADKINGEQAWRDNIEYHLSFGDSWPLDLSTPEGWDSAY